MLQNLDPKIGGFFLVTGFSFAAFASGFSVCLFNMDTVNECAEVSNMWLERFIVFGGHIIEWFFALLRAVLTRQGG
jgi:hypothetical protein